MSKNSVDNSVLILLFVSTLLMAISMLLIGEHRAVNNVTDFYLLTGVLSANLYNLVAAIGFFFIAIFSILTIKNGNFRKSLAFSLIAISVVPLVALLSSSMWIEKLGGFPAIGSGQGVIKYFALLAVGLYFLSNNNQTLKGKITQLFPVVLVLLWIGGMKFTELEAKGIEDLVASSPLMSWMYHLWDVQTTSNLIGIYDLIAVVLLVLSLINRVFLWPAVLMAGAVFITTQTFLLTWDAALSAETILSTGGHFLIKDLWFVANLIIFVWLVNSKNEVNN